MKFAFIRWIASGLTDIISIDNITQNERTEGNFIKLLWGDAKSKKMRLAKILKLSSKF